MELLPPALLEPPRPVVAVLGPYNAGVDAGSGPGSTSGSGAADDICDRLCRAMPARGELQSLRVRLFSSVVKNRDLRKELLAGRGDAQGPAGNSGVPDSTGLSSEFEVEVAAFGLLRGEAAALHLLPKPRVPKGSFCQRSGHHGGSGAAAGGAAAGGGGGAGGGGAINGDPLRAHATGGGAEASGGPAETGSGESTSSSSNFIAHGKAPRGILRAGWLHKHTKVLPSVVVLVFSADGGGSGTTAGDVSWARTEQHITEEVTSVRKALTGGGKEAGVVNRPIRIVVVIVHRSESSVFDERLRSLQKGAHFDKTVSFVMLPRGPQDLFESTCRRISEVISDQARNYYKEIAKSIKREYKRGHVNKSTQLAFYVRHHFKMAFFAEMRQDFGAAFKLYTAAFKHAKDLAISAMKRSQAAIGSGALTCDSISAPGLSNTHALLELKTVGDFLNFQLCKILLSHGQVSDAVEQFQQHMKVFRPAAGDLALEFEHVGWLARQHLLFGQLLEALPRATYSNELPGSSAVSDGRQFSPFSEQSPCFYTARAAQLQRSRRDIAQRLIGSVATYLPGGGFTLGSALKALPPDAFIPFEPCQIDNTAQSYVGECTCRFYLTVQRAGASPDPLGQTGATALTATAINPLSPENGAKQASREGGLHDVTTAEVSALALRHAAREIRYEYSSDIQFLLQVAKKQYENRNPNGVSRNVLALQAGLASEILNGLPHIQASDLVFAADLVEACLRSHRDAGCLSLLTASLVTAMRCCEIHASASDSRVFVHCARAFVAHALEYLGPYSTASVRQKQAVQARLERLVYESGKGKDDNMRLASSLDIDMLCRRLALPCSVGSALKLPVDAPVGMHHLPRVASGPVQSPPLIELETKFARSLVYAEQVVRLTLTVTSHFEAPVKFSALNIRFSNPKYDISRSSLSDESSDDITLGPHVRYFFHFDIMTAAKELLTVRSVSLEHGNGPPQGPSPAPIRFFWVYNETDLPEAPAHVLPLLRQTSVQVLQPRGDLGVRIERESDDAPVLQGEAHPTLLVCRNNGAAIQKGQVFVSLQSAVASAPGEIESTEAYLSLPQTPNEKHTSLNFPLMSEQSGTLARDSSLQIGLFVCLMMVGRPCRLQVQVEYTTVENKTTTTEAHVDLAAQGVFSVQRNIYTPQLIPCPSPQVSEPFLYYLEFVVNDHGVAVVVLDTNLRMPKPRADSGGQDILSILSSHRTSADTKPPVELLASTDSQRTALLSDTEQPVALNLSPGSRFSVWSHMVLHASGTSVPLGSVQVRWRRARSEMWERVMATVSDTPSDEDMVVSSVAPLPALQVDSAPFVLKVETPPFARVGEVSKITLRIHNYSPLVQGFRLQCGDGLPSFMTSGPTVRRFSVAPRGVSSIEFRVVPIVAGRQPLPHIVVVSERTAAEVTSSSQIRYLFVNPSATPTRHLR